MIWEWRDSVKNQTLYKVLTAFCVIGCIVCVILGLFIVKGKSDKANGMSDLQQMTVKENESMSKDRKELQNELGVEIPGKNLDFTQLNKVNSDIYAWIYIPGTEVDYPILQHPSDDTFYLEHNMDGSSGLPGCIYSELMNGISFEDRNTVLYGHNMRNGSMFATLHRYADKAFFDENKYIFIYTKGGKTLVYRIYAAYTYSDVHLLKGIDITSDEKFEEYLKSVKDTRGINDNFASDVLVSSDDKIITLSTCTGDDSKRYLVQGVLLNDR